MTLPIESNKDMFTTLKFPTPELLAEAIDDYFEGLPKDKITNSGLCLHINLGKDALLAYGKREGYKKIVAMAKLRIENAYETSLREKGGAGNIFALKNFGWIDKQEHEHSGSSTNPLITKIVREVVNVKQIEHIPAAIAKEITGDPNDDLSADAGLPSGLDDLADEYDDFLQ